MTNVHVGAPSLALLHLLTGCWISQALYVAAKLGIADLLQEGPQSCTQLAEAPQTHPRALYRVLRALASVGGFVKDEAECFRLTPLAEPLCTDAPGSLRAFALMLGAQSIGAHGRACSTVSGRGHPPSTMSSASHCLNISQHIQKRHRSLMTR